MEQEITQKNDTGDNIAGSGVFVDKKNIQQVQYSIQKEVAKTVWIHWFLWGIVIVILLAILATQIPRMNIGDNYIGIILAFVGILATFTVVGNYIQVHYAKQEFEKKVKELQQKINNLGNVDDKIGQAKKEIEARADGQSHVLHKNIRDLEEKMKESVAEKSASLLFDIADGLLAENSIDTSFHLHLEALRRLCLIEKRGTEWYSNTFSVLWSANSLFCDYKDKVNILPSQEETLLALKKDFESTFPDLFQHVENQIEISRANNQKLNKTINN